MASDSVGAIKTGDSTIYYEKMGVTTGVPLFMLNGGPGFDHSYFRITSVWEGLATNRPIVFYDQRGTGKSSEVGDDDSCTLADQLADLDAVREHLGYGQIDILGHSWGGYLGMAYTARHSDRVRRLILVGSAAPKIDDTLFLFENIFPETTERQEAVAYAMEFNDEDAIQSYMLEYLSMLFYSYEIREAILDKMDPTGYRHRVNQLIWQDIQRFDLNPELKKFQQPALVITGRYDINVAPSVAYKIHKAIPGSRFKVFDRSGHLPFFEEPEAFVQLIEEFLS